MNSNVGAFGIAVLVLGFVGAYALLYPTSQAGELCIGALLPIAGGIGTYFFHTASQSFLGTQLSAQRTAFAAALPGATANRIPSATTGSMPPPIGIQAATPPAATPTGGDNV